MDVDSNDFSFTHPSTRGPVDGAVHVQQLPFLGPSTDEAGIDHTGAIMLDMVHNDSQFRRDSLNSSVLSPPPDTKWETISSSDAVSIATRRTSLTSNNHYRDVYASANSAYSLSASAPSSSAWQLNHASGTASPLSLEPFSATGDDYMDSYMSHDPTTDDSGAASSPAIRPSNTVLRSNGQHEDGVGDDLRQLIATTSSAQDNLAATASANDGHGRALPRHMRPGYRPARPTATRASSDGVRKKNARIEIPSERNLNNIEELIEKAGDDELVKELKVQRRLLRNREAALASRQRKKAHTEDLEVREQEYIKRINNLKHDCQELLTRRNQLEHENGALQQKYAEVCQMVNGLEMDKEDLIIKHSHETAELRRKLQFFSEQAHDANDLGPMMQSNSLNDFTSDMKALTVQPQPWTAYGQQHHATSSAPTVPSTQPAAHRDTLSAPQAQPKKPEEPVASGMLFMILLCGAFVASRTQDGTVLPKLPDEVRAASTTVLDTLLKDSRADIFGPAPSGNTNMPQQPQYHYHDVSQADGAHAMYRALTMPTRQQEAEQLFHLSADEYNAYTTSEPYLNHPQPTALPRRNLADTLAGLRHESISRVPTAEGYTRSLLWDQVPTEVVKQFKELIKGSTTAEAMIRGNDLDTIDMKHEYHEGLPWPYQARPA